MEANKWSSVAMVRWARDALRVSSPWDVSFSSQKSIPFVLYRLAWTDFRSENYTKYYAIKSVSITLIIHFS